LNGNKRLFDKIISWLPSSTRTSWWMFVYLMTVYSLLRLIFFIVNYPFYSYSSAVDIIKAFGYGLRFDIAAIIMVNLPLLVLFNLPIKFEKIKMVEIIFFVFFCLLNLLGITLNIADLGYYTTIQRRLLFEPFTALPDLFRMLPGLVKNYLPLILFYLATIAAFVYFTFKLLRKIGNKQQVSFSYIKSSIAFIPLILLSIIGIRGGLQLKPIRQTNAFFSDDRQLGYLVLNSTYTVLRSYFQSTFPEYNFYSDDESRKIVDGMIKSDDEEMLDPAYPFLRRKIPTQPMLKKNIIIFVMESWSAQYIGSMTGGKTSTPFFDSLAKDGILYTNYVSSCQRSIEAIPSILASLPAVFPSSIIGSRTEINKIRGIGSILREKGYTTSFHHGAENGSMGFDGFVPTAGFTNYFSKATFEGYADSLYDGEWGIFDEPFFIDAAKKIGKFNEPFCSVVFSLSSHDPLTIPKYRQHLFDHYKSETKFQTALRYSDFSLSQFFEYAKKEPWYSNTVFLITGDHTSYTTRNNLFAAYNVPLLIYAPGLIKPKVDTRIGSHTDILPTILDLLHISTVHSSMGKSLLDDSKMDISVNTLYPIFICFTPKGIYTDDLEKRKEFFPDRWKTTQADNTVSTSEKTYNPIQKIMKAFIQTCSHAVNNDLIYKDVK
jgi:phosphoglycerol transferase MdoB-like AlkP superfamily enzyme